MQNHDVTMRIAHRLDNERDSRDAMNVIAFDTATQAAYEYVTASAADGAVSTPETRIVANAAGSSGHYLDLTSALAKDSQLTRDGAINTAFYEGSSGSLTDKAIG